MRNTLIDAGPLIALFDKSDSYHLAAIRFIETYEGRLWTTWPVITETSHMLDFHIKSQVNFLKWIERGGVRIVDISEDHIPRIIELSEKFDDVPMDLADTSLIAASELKGYDEIASIDSDFYIYRTLRNKYLTNVFQ